MTEYVDGHVVCPHCLTEFDQQITTHVGEPDEHTDAGFMLCPHCLGVSLFEHTPFGPIARIPDAFEQQGLDNDPLIQAVLDEARRARGEL